MKPEFPMKIGTADRNDPIYGGYLTIRKNQTHYVIWVERNGKRISAYLNPDSGEQFKPLKEPLCRWHRYDTLPELMAATLAAQKPRTLH